jgi:hypothetical protein
VSGEDENGEVCCVIGVIFTHVVIQANFAKWHEKASSDRRYPKGT